MSYDAFHIHARDAGSRTGRSPVVDRQDRQIGLLLVPCHHLLVDAEWDRSPVRTEGRSVGDFLRVRPLVCAIAIAAVVILASNGSSWALWLLLAVSLGMSTVIAVSTVRSSMTIDATGVTDCDGLRTRHYPWRGSGVDSSGPPRRRAVLIGYQRSRFGKGSQRHLVVCCVDDRRPHALKGA